MGDSRTKEHLTRKEAAIFLSSIGYSVGSKALAAWAANNNARKGPPFTRLSGRTVRYSKVDLRAWYDSRAKRIE